MKTIEINIGDIIVKDRARKDYGEIGELAQSIKEVGLIQPIVIDNENNLIAGERRLKAVGILNWTNITAVRYDELSTIQKLTIELHENSKRKNFSWQEDVELKEKILNLKQEEDPTFTIEKAVEFIGDGKSLRSYQDDLFLAKAIKRNPEIAKEKDKANARRKAERIQERDFRKLMLQASGDSDGISSPKGCSVRIENVDCVKGMQKLPDNCIDLVITDFPFGVDLNKNHDFKKSWDEVYEDDEADLLHDLLPDVAFELARIMKEGAHGYIFFPSKFYTEFKAALFDQLNLDPIPLIWNKMVGGTSFAPYSRYAPNYEPILHIWKGTSRKSSAPGYSVLNFENKISDKTHPAEKPVSLITYLVEQSSIEGETILDCFSGSGVTMAVSKRLNRKGIAFELSTRWFELGIERISK